MAVAFVPFDAFVRDLGLGVHNLNADNLEIYLSDTAPDAATNAVKADVPEIAIGNGYTGPQATGNGYTEAGGTGTLSSVAAITITAAGGPVGPFRYLIFYNATHAAGPLIGYWDYGAAVTLGDGATFTINVNSPPQVLMTISP